ncbi:unnamed protein product [Mytilus edulis]|uniref:Ig-like domain-containing protein n=1 Tax=Mytilus edulis TaxID=6550 RepID=A0A8S3SYW6_MYTED|nr:unnamed protein product [Mytilus edulis]
MAPDKVNISKETNLWWKMYWPKRLQPKTEKARKPFRFKIGDKVRITYIRNPFTREYDEKWSGEIFKISQRILRGGLPVYRLIDFQDEEISGTFYQSEVQKVDVREDDMWKVEKILKTKGRGPNKQYYVCYAKKYVEPGGIELFDLGCGVQSLCSTSDPFGKRDIVETDIEDDKGTSTICLACCNTTDLCNINGLCGAPPFIALPGTSLCYDCEVSRQPDDCTKITLCNTRQSCHLESTRNLVGDIRWRHGCVDKKQCQTSNSSQCSYCCNTDLCNTNTTFTQSPTSDNLFAVSKPHISGIDVQPRYIRYGSTVTIKCNVSGNPTPSVSFLVQETLHLPSTMLYMLVSRDVTGNPTPSVNFVVQGKSLASNVHVAGNTATISNYLPRNDDVYRCQATNCLDNSFYQFQLQAHL